MAHTTVTTYAKPWETTLLPVQYFGRCRVTGLRYQNGGEVAWHVTTWLSTKFNHPHDYWITADGTFHNFSRGETFIEITELFACRDCREIAALTGRFVPVVSPEERQAATEAIAKWRD
jgi:hypothetical protein